MAADQMQFPENFELFISSYKFKDKEEFYTNGSDLIQVFRVMQGWEHYTEQYRLKHMKDMHSRDRIILELYSLLIKILNESNYFVDADVETIQKLNSLYQDLKEINLESKIDQKILEQVEKY